MLNKKAGFTFIEVIVAIFIVGMVIVGVFVVIQNTISDRAFATHQLQAAYLAQEGVELVRNQRDENWLNMDPWSTDLPSNPREPVSGTRFDREINVDDTGIDGDGNEFAEIDVIVYWSHRGREYNLSVSTLLYNWYEPGP